jgi:hypothetical protein
MLLQLTKASQFTATWTTSKLLERIDDNDPDFRYESYTTALWNNILDSCFPINGPDGYMLTHVGDLSWNNVRPVGLIDCIGMVLYQ